MSKPRRSQVLTVRFGRVSGVTPYSYCCTVSNYRGPIQSWCGESDYQTLRDRVYSWLRENHSGVKTVEVS